jgi:hypothetical protein
MRALLLASTVTFLACAADQPGGGGGGGGVDAASPDEPDGGSSPGGDAGSSGDDPFGVDRIYPTVAGGREWFLPANGDEPSPEWNPDGGSRGGLQRTGEPGVFKVRGSPRLPVKSPAGKAWFRNIEMTMYIRYVENLPPDEQANPRDTFGWQFLARGERHTTDATVDTATINDGVPPPAGTATSPGYPFAPGRTVNSHCLAASMHGYLEVDGRVRFKKEVSHTGGYTDARGTVQALPTGMPVGGWVGYKFVVRNMGGDRAVHMESWIDAAGDGTWQKASEADDTGGWAGGEPDGCDAAPFGFAADQLITWAGPWILFRFDNIESDVKWLSVREIAPLP